MKKTKQISKREKAESIAILLMYPLVMMFRKLGKNFKLFSTKKRQLVASFLSIVMVFCAMPIVSLSANAASEHTHCLCGKTHREVGNHNKENLTEFTAWTKSDSLPWEEGKYYLTQNCYLDKPYFIQSGQTSKTITICLNGYSIIDNFDQFYKDHAANYPYGVIYVQGNTKLILTDCKNTGSIKSNTKGLSCIFMDGNNSYVDIYSGNFKDTTACGIYVDEGNVNLYGGTFKGNDGYGIHIRRGMHSTNTLNMYAGTITGNGLSKYVSKDIDNETMGGGICNGAGCLLNIYGGTISRNNGSFGGGVLSYGEFNFYGGSISNNNARNGGGVFTDRQFTMTGGSINDNSALEHGGGIFNRRTNDNSILNIKGGSIGFNNAAYGGGIFNASWSGNLQVNISGGSITNNTATAEGGGVHIGQCSTLNLTSSNITSNKVGTADAPGKGGGIYASSTKASSVKLNISGNVTVENNKNVDVDNNFYLNNPSSYTTQLAVTGSLTGGKIGVTNSNVKANNGIIANGSGYTITESDAAKIVSDNKEYETVLKSNKVLIKKILANLSIDNFVFTPPTNLTYDGNEKTATVTAKDGIACGAITVKYYNSKGTKLPTAPTDAGVYTVKIDVDESDEYNSLKDLTLDSWKFEILPKALTNSDLTVTGIEDNYIFTGNIIKPVPEVKYGEKTLTKGTDYELTYGKNIIGQGNVKIVLKGNYKGETSHTFTIAYGTADDSMYSMPQANEKGWYNSNITITANDGYKIGTIGTKLADSITIDDESNNGTLEIYLKSNETGCVYKGTVSYKLDKTIPNNIEVKYNDNTFKKILNTITFGLFFKENVSVEAKAEDDLSGVNNIMYYAADSEIANVSEITEWTDSLNLTPNCKKIVYIKVTDNAGNKVICNDQGIVLYSDSIATLQKDVFDLNTEKQSDITVDLTLNDNTLKEIKNGQTTLTANTDYTVDGNKVVISKNYLNKYIDGDEVSLTFVFNPMGVEGNEVSQSSVTIKITDTTDYHKTSTKTEYKAPTCTEKGNEAYWYCPVCGKYFADNNGAIDTSTAYDSKDTFDIEKIDHKNAVKTDYKAPICTEKGNETYWYCGDCEKYFADDDGVIVKSTAYDSKDVFDIEKIDHKNAVKTDYKAPICTEKGNKAYWYCGDCNKYFADKDGAIDKSTAYDSKDVFDIEKINHKDAVKTDYKAPTCTEKGNKDYWYCGDCQKYFADDNGTLNGDTAYDSKDVFDIEKIDHKNAVKTDYKAPICTEKGNKAYWYCGDCNKYFADKDGAIDKSTAYDSKDVFDIEKINHKDAVKTDYKAPTCTEKGNKDYWYCGDCQKYFADDNGTLNGDTAYDSKDVFDIEKIDHKNAVKTDFKASICTEKGNKDYWYCGDCGKYFADNDGVIDKSTAYDGKDIFDIEKIDHKNAVKTDYKAPTCTEKGNKAYWYCDDCKKYFADKNGVIDKSTAYEDTKSFVIKELGHDFSGDALYDDENHWHKCTRENCDVLDTKQAHEFDEGKITTPATAAKEGVKTYTCKFCAKTKTESVAKIAPTIIEGNNGKFVLGSNNGLSVKIDGLIDDLVSVSVDGKELEKDDYTTDSTTSKITLSAKYLNSLSSGKHTVEIKTISGTATSEITVNETKTSEKTTKKNGNKSNENGNKSPKNPTSPQTGDTNKTTSLFFMILSFIAFSTIVIINRKKKTTSK